MSEDVPNNSQHEEVRISETRILDRLPLTIRVGKKNYILSQKENGEIVLYSSVCPHMHGLVKPINKKLFRCASHGWTFNPENGQGINVPQACLKSYPVIKKEKHLFAKLPKTKIFKRDIQKKTLNNLNDLCSQKKPPFTLKLLSNACFMLEYNNFRILTDPWLEGPAFFCSWTQYPVTNIKVSDLPKIDVILITHEHSDHLHPKSLSKFDKNIPIYVTDIYQGRLVKIIKSMGFKNVKGLRWEEKVKLQEDISFMFFEPASGWSDSIMYLDIAGFKILNFNDAGANWEIKKKIDHVDMICSEFSTGASGFPTTWRHINPLKKKEIIKNNNIGTLNLLKEMVENFKPKYLLPLASFSELFEPKHRDFYQIASKNRISDVVDFFKKSQVKVIDLLPGEGWNAANNTFSRRPDHNLVYEQKYLFDNLDREFEKVCKNDFYPTVFTITQDKIKEYFNKFSGSDLSKEVGKVSISITLREKLNTKKRVLHGSLIFDEGKVIYTPKDQPTPADIIMDLPGSLIQKVIEEDLSWDEVHIGYWGEFSRNPDIYHINVWKFFHAPWKYQIK